MKYNVLNREENLVKIKDDKKRVYLINLENGYIERILADKSVIPQVNPIHGYYRIKIGGPFNKNWVLQHRLICEIAYNMDITLYSVHHINGNKTDNSINNLLLCNPNQHSIIHANTGNEKVLEEYAVNLKPLDQAGLDRYLGIVR